MWSSLKPRYKLLIALIAMVIVLLAGYQMAFKKSITLYKENSHLSLLNAKGEAELLLEISKRTSEKKRIDSLLINVNSGSSLADFSYHLFETAADNGVRIVEISEIQKTKGNFCKVTGSYLLLVKFLRDVEKNILAYTIESATFYTERERRSKKEFLYLELKFSKMKNDE